MIPKYCKGPVAYISALAVILFAHSCAVERDQAAEPPTTKAATGHNA